MRPARLLLLAAAGLPPACGPRPGASSPEAAFMHARACISARDWGGFFDSVAPADRDLAIGAWLYVAAFARMAGDSAEKDYAALMTAHGLSAEPPDLDPTLLELPPRERLARHLAPVRDRRAFYVAIAAFTTANMKDLKPLIDPAATVKDIRITGDTASGTLAKPGGKSSSVRFQRVDGRWFLALDP